MSAYHAEMPRSRAQLILMLAIHLGLDYTDDTVMTAIEEEHRNLSDQKLATVVAFEGRMIKLQLERLEHLRPYAAVTHENWSSVFVIDEDGQHLAFVNTPGGDVLLPWTIDELLPEYLWPNHRSGQPSFRVYNTDHHREDNAVFEEDGSIVYYPIDDRTTAARYETYRSREEHALALNEWQKLAAKNDWWKRVQKDERTPFDYPELGRKISRLLTFLRRE